jgi:hypothetical protein
MDILFTLFGFFIGFRMFDWQAPSPWKGLASWTALWYLVTTGWSMFFGAWCASRLSGDPVEGDGFLHGVCTWGVVTAITFGIVGVASWAVLREGINVLGTAAVMAQQVAPGAIPHLSPGELPGAVQNAGPTAQATTRLISNLAFIGFWSVLLSFVMSLLGGWLGQRRSVVVTGGGVFTLPTRRAA